MIKDLFIRERTDRRELMFLSSLDKKYILVEGKNDKLFYSHYFLKVFNKKVTNKVEFKDCGGFLMLHKILNDKRNKKGYNNYFAIIDRDSQKYWSTVSDLSVFNDKYTLRTDGYCMENYYFTSYNLPKILKSLESFLVMNKDKKTNYLANLKELLKEFMSEFCDDTNFNVYEDFYNRSSVKYINVIKNASVESVQIIEDNIEKKYYDNIPSSFDEVHGKDLLLTFILLINYLDDKYNNEGVSIFDDRNSILSMPHQLIDKILGFKIKNLDNFFKLVMKSR